MKNYLTFAAILISLLLQEQAFARNQVAAKNLGELSPEAQEFLETSALYQELSDNETQLLDKAASLERQVLSLQGKLKTQAKQYHHFFYWLKGRSRSGYEHKYDERLYPQNSLYRTITSENITDIARLTAAVYKTSNDCQVNRDFQRELEKFRQENMLSLEYQQLVTKLDYLEDKKRDINNKIQEMLAQEQYQKWLQSFCEDLQVTLNDSLQHICTSQANDYQTLERLLSRVDEAIVKLGVAKKEVEIKQRELTFQDNPHKLALEKQEILLEPQFQNFEIIHIMYRNGTEFSGAVLYNNDLNKMIIVFAGSKSGMDWVNNLQAWGKAGNADLNIGGHGFSIHTGVLNLLSEGLDRFVVMLNRFIREYQHPKPLTILVAGHSLGGALSTLVAYHIKSHLLPKYYHKVPALKETLVQNISFGAPRFVDPQGAKLIEASLGKANILRFWNSRDIVPAIVLGLANSKHVGLDFPLWDSFFYEWYLPVYTHHSMTRYWALSAAGFDKVRKENTLKLETFEDIDNLKDYIAYLKENIEQTAEDKGALEGRIESLLEDGQIANELAEKQPELLEACTSAIKTSDHKSLQAIKPRLELVMRLQWQLEEHKRVSRKEQKAPSLVARLWQPFTRIFTPTQTK